MKKVSLLGLIVFTLILSGCESIPLVGAARKGDVAMMESLIQGGADINQAEYGHTPLYGAAQRGNVDAVKYLIKKGANTDLGPLNSTPLTVALERSHDDVVIALIEGGADANKALYMVTQFRLSDADAGSMFMTDAKQVKVASFLLSNGADVNHKNAEYNGNTALHGAAIKGDGTYLLADFLNKNGADNTIKNAQGFTAYQVCRACGPGMSKIVNGTPMEDL